MPEIGAAFTVCISSQLDASPICILLKVCSSRTIILALGALHDLCDRYVMKCFFQLGAGPTSASYDLRGPHVVKD